MVAKSYQSLKQITEPYTVNGRQYVKVLDAKGNAKQVRYYTEHEYEKMYPEEKTALSKQSPYYRSQKDVLGFKNGYITIFKGDTEAYPQYFKAPTFRYARCWKWSLDSTAELPDGLPEGITPVRLDWELVGKDDENLKDDKSVIAAVESVLYDEDPSQFVGSVGQRQLFTLKVLSTFNLESDYGAKVLHKMSDASGNIFIWTTTKRLVVGKTYELTGTIKEHKIYHNCHQTVLTNCRAKEV